MNLDKLGQWIGIIANVGVFAGFLLVAYQLHQSTISLQSNAVYTSNQLFANSDMSMMGDTTYEAFAHALVDPASLTPAELAQLWSYSSVTMFSAIVAFDDYQQGIISEDRWIAIQETFITYINHPIGRIIWEAQSQGVVDLRNRAFIDSVQARLERAPRNLTQTWFRAMMKAVRALPSESDRVALPPGSADTQPTAP